MSAAIIVKDISKQYRLGQIGTGTVSHDLNRWWHKVRGKEDPYLKIGEANDRAVKGETEYVWALRDVNFKVEQGEVLGIIGRNGAGKSTLLKILSRTTAPTTGNIKVKGRIASLLEVGTGFHPELSGRENIFLNGAILGMGKHEIKSKFDEIVDFAGVERYIDTPVKRYSSGMYVRLAFGVAAHLESEILIVDEVLAVGDAEFQKKCLGKMKDVSANEGRTVLFVSHQMGTIAGLCKRSLLMGQGLVVKDDLTANVISDYLSRSEGSKSKVYEVASTSTSSKECFFEKVSIENEHGQTIDQFSFDQEIFIKALIRINNVTNNTYIGIGLQDKNNVRVSTFLRPVTDFIKGVELQFPLTVTLPSKVIAPNSYSFTIALFEPNGKVYDLVENILPFRLVDSGTDYSVFEGIDYGSVILNANWEVR
jgi:lipopolysaccharide transport system ATP-binding protein